MTGCYNRRLRVLDLAASHYYTDGIIWLHQACFTTKIAIVTSLLQAWMAAVYTVLQWIFLVLKRFYYFNKQNSSTFMICLISISIENLCSRFKVWSFSGFLLSDTYLFHCHYFREAKLLKWSVLATADCSLHQITELLMLSQQ